MGLAFDIFGQCRANGAVGWATLRARAVPWREERVWKMYRPDPVPDPVLVCIAHWCGTKWRVMLQLPVHARGGVP